ncbi:type VI secretion system protein TssL, short form [Salmonella enterica]
MKQEIDIDALMAETWLTVTMLKHGATTLDGQELYQKCCKQVESVREALERAGYDETSINHISYAQCALLDETVMSRRPQEIEGGMTPVDDGYLAWRKAPLQARYFGSLRAGEALWDRVVEALNQPVPQNAVLTCYHRVIMLGFQGLYGLKTVGPAQRDEVIKALSEHVSIPDAGLSLVTYRTEKRRYNLLRSVWFWVFTGILITGMVWWGGHLWLQSLLAENIPELPR